MAWVKFGKDTINMHNILKFGTGHTYHDRSYDAIFLSDEELVNLSELRISQEKAMQMIAEAERAERKLAFEENKQDLVDAVADAVYRRLNHIDKPKTETPFKNNNPPKQKHRL